MSAPIMYISARLVLITKASDAQYENVIQNTRRDVTIVALIGLVSKFLYTMVALLLYKNGCVYRCVLCEYWEW